MTHRDSNRKREHEPHGWFRSTKTTAKPTAGLIFVECPCGWIGWISEAAAPTAEGNPTP